MSIKVNQQKDIILVANAYVFFTLNLSPIKNFNSSLTGTYTGSMLVPHFGLNANITR